MRFEPPIERERLLDAIRAAYALPARELEFLPVGLGAACYLLHVGGEERRFVKVWTRLRLERPGAERQHASLVLTRALHDRGIGVRVPHPIRTRQGALWADLAGTPFALFPLLPGAPPNSPWPAGLGEALGRALAAIHRATPAVADVIMRRELLDVPFEAALRRNLAIAASLGQGARPGLLALRRWALARQDDILAQLARLHALRAAARRVEGPTVLCHTDLHRDNLLVDGAGQLAVLDWDDAKLAPPEHDLWAGLGDGYRGEDFAAFLAAYRRAGGSAPLHVEQFAFYLLRRHLEDMAVDLAALLAPDADAREDAALLDAMEDWGVANWSRLDATLAPVAAALRQHVR